MQDDQSGNAQYASCHDDCCCALGGDPGWQTTSSTWNTHTEADCLGRAAVATGACAKGTTMSVPRVVLATQLRVPSAVAAVADADRCAARRGEGGRSGSAREPPEANFDDFETAFRVACSDAKLTPTERSEADSDGNKVVVRLPT